MNKKNNFNDNCPSVSDFETYLKGTGSIEFNSKFNQHLIHCELCNQAIGGYKAAGITNIGATLKSTSTQFQLNTRNTYKTSIKTLAYAASIILFIAFSALYFTQVKKPATQSIADINYLETIESVTNNTKILAKKTNDNFIFIGTCDKVAYNDQFLSQTELLAKLKNQTHIDVITIEVASGNDACALALINSIKLQQNTPVITISKSKGLKKLTPWGEGV